MNSIAKPGWAFTVFNVVGFQIVWLLSVIGASRGYWLPGFLTALLFAGVVLHLSPDRRRDIRTAAIALPIGFLMDSLLAYSPVLNFSSPFPSIHWAPAWIMALWIGFTFTLNHSLKAIYSKPLYLFVFGFLGGPLAYFIAAQRFQAMFFESGIAVCLLTVAVVWGLGLSLIRWIDVAWTERTVGAGA
jgi:hypothetical protein